MEKRENKLIGAFDIQAEVLSKITELKSQGYSADDIYVVAQNQDQVSMVERQTHVHIDTDSSSGNGDSKEEGFMAKFINLLAGEEASGDAFNNMNLDGRDAEQYRQYLEDGKLLVYVDSDFNDSYNAFHEKRGTTAARQDFTAENTHHAIANDEPNLGSREDQMMIDKDRDRF